MGSLETSLSTNIFFSLEMTEKTDMHITNAKLHMLQCIPAFDVAIIHKTLDVLLWSSTQVYQMSFKVCAINNNLSFCSRCYKKTH